MDMRKPKEECTLSEYQFFWCTGEGGHREAGIAMPVNTVCKGCVHEFYRMKLAKCGNCAVCSKPIGPAVWCSLACMEKHIGPTVAAPKT